MTSLRIFTVIIFALTIAVISGRGVLWPLTFFSDLIAVEWRAGFGLKGSVFWFLSIFLGGMFTFPYVLIASYQAKGNMSEILSGARISNSKKAMNA